MSPKVTPDGVSVVCRDYLQQRVSVLQEPAHNGVTSLVIRHSLLLCGLQYLSLLLQT